LQTNFFNIPVHEERSEGYIFIPRRQVRPAFGIFSLLAGEITHVQA
jgi:hypothetical protein